MRSPKPNVSASTPDAYDAALTAFNYLYKTSVANGVCYLDKRVPGWAKRVDLNTFNMAYTNADILSQVYDTDTRKTAEYQNWSHAILRAHGMWSWPDERHGYDSLTLLWREAILERINGETK